MEATADDHSHSLHLKSPSLAASTTSAVASHTSPALPPQTFGTDVSPLPPKRHLGAPNQGSGGSRVSVTKPRQGSGERPLSAKVRAARVRLRLGALCCS